MKFDRLIDSTAAKVPVKFQSDRTILNTNLTASRLYGNTSFRILRKRGPVSQNHWGSDNTTFKTSSLTTSHSSSIPIPIWATTVLINSIDDYFSTHRRCHNNFAMRPFRQSVISPLCARGRNGGWARLVALVENRDLFEKFNMPMFFACFPHARAATEHAHSIWTFNQGTTGYATAYPNLDRQIKRAQPPDPAGGEMTDHMTAMWWYPRDSVTQSVLHCDFKIFNKNEKKHHHKAIVHQQIWADSRISTKGSDALTEHAESKEKKWQAASEAG